MLTVDYSYKYQFVLPEAGQKTTRVEMLYLDHNRLVTVPESLQFPCLWSSLKILLLHSNKLTSLPSEIGSLKSLSVLHLYDNLLTSLPDEIARLENLQVLYLNDNFLEILPSKLNNLTRLQKFTLHRNKLRYLPSTLYQIVDYLQVSLEGNPLIDVPEPVPKAEYFFAGETPDLIPSLTRLCRRVLSNLNYPYDLDILSEDLVIFLAEKKIPCQNCSFSFFPDEGTNLVLFGHVRDLWIPFKYDVCSMLCTQESISQWRAPKYPNTPTVSRIR